MLMPTRLMRRPPLSPAALAKPVIGIALFNASLTARTLFTLVLKAMNMIGKQLIPFAFYKTEQEARDWLALLRKAGADFSLHTPTSGHLLHRISPCGAPATILVALEAGALLPALASASLHDALGTGHALRPTILALDADEGRRRIAEFLQRDFADTQPLPSPFGRDTDADGLPDLRETGDAIYRDSSRTGTGCRCGRWGSSDRPRVMVMKIACNVLAKPDRKSVV